MKLRAVMLQLHLAHVIYTIPTVLYNDHGPIDRRDKPEP